jgi:hypothetical protein
VEITGNGLDFLENAPTPIHHRFMEKLKKMDSRDVSQLMWGLELLVDMLAQADPVSPSLKPPLDLIESEEELSVPNGNI